MSTDGTSTKVLLLLGAGFSRHAGLPVMSEFGQDKWHKRRMERVRIASALSQEMLRNAGRIFGEFQEFCGNAGGVVTTDADNMEVIFSIAESLEKSGFPGLPIDGRNIPIDKVIDNIKLWLWNIYQGLPHVFDWDTCEEVRGLYCQFAKTFSCWQIN